MFWNSTWLILEIVKYSANAGTLTAARDPSSKSKVEFVSGNEKDGATNNHYGAIQNNENTSFDYTENSKQ